jgi:ATP-dependent Clp protease ATP-binding subunit ClpC
MDQSRFTDRARKAMRVAIELAAAGGRSHAAPEDVLWALATIELGPGRVALQQLGVNIANCADQIKLLPASSIAADEIIRQAYLHAQALSHCYIGTEHLTLATLTAGNGAAAAYLRERGVSENGLRWKVKEVLGH